VDIWPLVHQPDVVTLVGAFPGTEEMARLEMRQGIAVQSSHDSHCELKAGDRFQLFGGTSTYEVPIESEQQLDPEPAFYFGSSGFGGSRLHETKRGSATTWTVPDTLSLVQVDTSNVDIIFGMVWGSCLGSSHALRGSDVAFSLCKFRKSTGEVQTIHRWTSRFEFDVASVAASLNPIEGYYMFFIYDTLTGADMLSVVNVNSGVSVQQTIPPQAAGTIESMWYDVLDDAVFVSVIQQNAVHMFHLEETDGQNFNWISRGEFTLDSRSNEHYAFSAAFHGGANRMQDGSRKYTMLYETSMDRYLIAESMVSSAQDGNRYGLLSTSFVVSADVQMLVTHIYVAEEFTAGAGKDGVNTPSVIHTGAFEHLTIPGEPIEVQIFVEDLDVPSHLLLEQVTLRVLTDHPELLPGDPHMIDSPTGSVGAQGFPQGCTTMCMKALTPYRRVLRLTPRNFTGCALVHNCPHAQEWLTAHVHCAGKLESR
jgi:hypothetical protein